MSQTVRLDAIADAYRTMPNGGAVLQVLQDGAVSNGMVVIERYSTPSAAISALTKAGFHEQWNGWKLRNRIS